MAHVIWTEQAKNDLKEIYTFFRRDSEEYAEALTDRLFWSTDRLEQFPSSGRMVPEFRSQNVREIIVSTSLDLLCIICSRKLLKNNKNQTCKT